MKMKEVLSRTGLTDRAVRLYIENGLVEPDCNESHSGRKSLEFSEKNVQELNNIALLRKAGFSIADIKLLMQGGEDARQVIEKYKSETAELIEWKEKVLEALESLTESSEITLETVCQSLSVAVADRKLPAEDNKLTILQRIEVYSFRTVSIIGLVLSLAVCVFLILFYKGNFRHTTFVPLSEQASVLIAFYIPIILNSIVSLALLVIYLKPKFGTIQHIVRVVVAFLLTVVLVCSVIKTPLAMAMVAFVPPVYSQTNSPADYLQLDSYVEEYSAVEELFPEKIPDEAIENGVRSHPWETYPKTVRYYYMYSHFVDPQFDLYAEWRLPKEVYAETRDEMFANPPWEIAGTREKGEWTCLYFADVEGEEPYTFTYYYLIFAYNDKTDTVRYIASYCMDTGDSSRNPYFVSLNW
ncbi:MAG: MerR family transcriptional regulator [Ruminococcus sp.]|nr:MerR family transcriptional regulator [Ruminococcus sp.]